jgi:hypothetical protein
LANRPVKLTGGRVLDLALIEKLSSEAERGYDLSKAKRVILREGRPARGEPGGESPRVASRIPEAIYRAAKKRAAGEGLTVSEVIRALLVGYAVGHSSCFGNTGPARSSDSDLTAMGANNGIRRRTISPAKRGRLHSRHTSAKVRGRKRP